MHFPTRASLALSETHVCLLLSGPDVEASAFATKLPPATGQYVPGADGPPSKVTTVKRSDERYSNG